jgi:hypothetical protein
MPFEPLGYSDKWYDRIVGHRLKSTEFIAVVIIVGGAILCFNL